MLQFYQYSCYFVSSTCLTAMSANRRNLRGKQLIVSMSKLFLNKDYFRKWSSSWPVSCNAFLQKAKYTVNIDITVEKQKYKEIFKVWIILRCRFKTLNYISHLCPKTVCWVVLQFVFGVDSILHSFLGDRKVLTNIPTGELKYFSFT